MGTDPIWYVDALVTKGDERMLEIARPNACDTLLIACLCSPAGLRTWVALIVAMDGSSSEPQT